MKKENNKKLLIIGVIIVVAITFITLGLTYAFFTGGVVGNDNATETVIETGELKLIFTDTDVITIEDALPGVSASKTFTIENIGTLETSYDIVLTELLNEFVGGELVYSLSSDNNGASVEETAVPTENNTILVSGTIAPGVVQTYTITIKFKETGANQNSNMGANFSGKLQINSTGEYSENTSILLTDVMFRDNPDVQSDEAIDFSQISSDTNGNGLYYTSDPADTETGEPVYYYRGAINNNNVIFAEKCWRIIRTNEDGSTRIMYYGVPDENGYCPEIGNQTAPITSQTFSYNAQDGQNAYVGFMYGTPGSSSYSAEHANTNNSNIKTQLETWYAANIKEGYRSKIANAVYCNDRSIGIGGTFNSNTFTELGYGNNNTMYGAARRLGTGGPTGTEFGNGNANPTFVCAQQNDEFTLSAANGGTDGYGNNKLTYPVGLITADEVSYAGGAYATENESYYLYYSTTWWCTISPFYFDGSYADVFGVNAAGDLDYGSVRYAVSAFPVISLNSDIKITQGDGTTISPYIVE